MNTLTQQPVVNQPIGSVTESAVSAVSWPAIFAGAFVATAASLVLVELGSGLGLASLSAWPNSGASAATFTVTMAIWLVVVQWLASGLGGYLAGRLRTKWANIHTHEVFFRDTAHGFITWAIGTVLVAIFVTSAGAAAITGGVHAATTVASAATGSAAGSAAASSSATPGDSTIAPYTLDGLFRSPRTESNSSAASAAEQRAEAARILANGLATGDIPTADRTYLAELVAERTGVSATEAQRRVDNAIAQTKAAEMKAREAADTARKAAAQAAIFAALSMLIGAFIACIAAALGGQRRDVHA
jgi:hypothetical protein